jgi:predicted nucleic acid-binding protein
LANRRHVAGGNRRSHESSQNHVTTSGIDVAYYLDTSAAVKLVQREAESTSLLAWAADHADTIVSSDLLRTELLRATRRGAPEHMSRARAVVDSITLLELPPTTFERAAELDPTPMGSLDAIHLAAARELGDELDAIVTYDERLAAAAHVHGITVIAPT